LLLWGDEAQDSSGGFPKVWFRPSGSDHLLQTIRIMPENLLKIAPGSKDATFFNVKGAIARFGPGFYQ